MKVCKRIPLECVNKCGAKDIPREEVSDTARAKKKNQYSPCDVNDRQLIPGKTLEAFLKYVLRKRDLENNTAFVDRDPSCEKARAARDVLEIRTT